MGSPTLPGKGWGTLLGSRRRARGSRRRARYPAHPTPPHAPRRPGLSVPRFRGSWAPRPAVARTRTTTTSTTRTFMNFRGFAPEARSPEKWSLWHRVDRLPRRRINKIGAPTSRRKNHNRTGAVGRGKNHSPPPRRPAAPTCGRGAPTTCGPTCGRGTEVRGCRFRGELKTHSEALSAAKRTASRSCPRPIRLVLPRLALVRNGPRLVLPRLALVLSRLALALVRLFHD